MMFAIDNSVTMKSVIIRNTEPSRGSKDGLLAFTQRFLFRSFLSGCPTLVCSFYVETLMWSAHASLSHSTFGWTPLCSWEPPRWLWCSQHHVQLMQSITSLAIDFINTDCLLTTQKVLSVYVEHREKKRVHSLDRPYWLVQVARKSTDLKATHILCTL